MGQNYCYRKMSIYSVFLLWMLQFSYKSLLLKRKVVSGVTLLVPDFALR
jgi:hypothetical protein